MMSDAINEQLVLISGESGTGKSAALRNIPNQERWVYCNCEAGKRLPFANKFYEARITDPYQVYEAFEFVKDNPDYDGVIIDTATFLMEMFESVYVVNAANTMAAWGAYGQFFKNLMQQHVAGSDKSVIILAHTKSELDESAGEYRTAVPVKGALKNNGIEAYFSTVVSTKKVALKDLEDYKSSLLNITEDDEILGYKHVFQTRLTKATKNERIRSPMGMFTKEQTFMDNDANLLLEHLNSYYGISSAA
jgi:hypothetical protein